MIGFLHRFLLLLPPEAAHAVGRQVLFLMQWFRFGVLRRPLPKVAALHLASVPKLVFRSRVGVAAGMDKNAEFFAGLACFGAGFVEVGTVTPQAQAGNPKPRLWRPAPGTLVNHMGFNSVGLQTFRQNIQRYRAQVKDLPLFANIGKNRHTPNEGAAEDYKKGFAQLTGYVDGFVVNLSSPNTPNLVQLQSAEFLTEIARLVPTGVPVWIKLSPDLDNPTLEKLARVVRDEARLSGVVVTNTSREMAEEVFDFDRGGLSGRPLFSRALECVSIVRHALGGEKTVVGVGGVWNRDTAKQMRRAGADLIEVYTGLVYRGPTLLRELENLE